MPTDQKSLEFDGLGLTEWLKSIARFTIPDQKRKRKLCAVKDIKTSICFSQDPGLFRKQFTEKCCVNFRDIKRLPQKKRIRKRNAMFSGPLQANYFRRNSRKNPFWQLKLKVAFHCQALQKSIPMLKI